MISFVRGSLISIEEDAIVVEANGFGMEIRVPLSVLDQLPPVGKEVLLYTYFQVREDAMSLYGFLSRQDKKIFTQLLGVNGVGPRAALGILSALKPDDLRMAIVSGDAKAISKAPGIGTKTAQKIILDLKDKVSVDELAESWMSGMAAAPEPDQAAMAGAGLNGAAREAVQALVALGYGNMEAARAVKQVELKDGMKTEDVLKASLRFLTFL